MNKVLYVIDNKKSLEEKEGVKIREVFFAFGRYDGKIIFEAHDERAVMKFVMETGFSTQHNVETLIAVPAKEL